MGGKTYQVYFLTDLFKAALYVDITTNAFSPILNNQNIEQ